MRSCVRCGIDFAAGERLITSETVAGESCNRAARDFRLTDDVDALPRVDFGADAILGGGIGVLRRSLSQRQFRGKRFTTYTVACSALETIR